MSENLDTHALEGAFSSLEQTLVQLAQTDWFEAQLPIVQDTLIAGAIQKFEFVYELSLKMMNRQLKKEAFSDEQVGGYSFKDVLREALNSGLIKNMENWVEYRTMRNITSHTYDQNKAMLVYEQISDFLEESRYLVEQLMKRNNHE